MSDCDRLLAVLSDGKEHQSSKLYAMGLMVHSRAADLRRKGHRVVVRREKGVRGAPGVWYRLVPLAEPELRGNPSARDRSPTPSPDSGSASGSPTGCPRSQPTSQGGEPLQLTLEAA